MVRRVASRRDDVGGVALEHWVTAWYSLRDDAQCVKRVQCDECVQHSVRSHCECELIELKQRVLGQSSVGFIESLRHMPPGAAFRGQLM